MRILFRFDTGRQAVLLVAGDKSGQWRGLVQAINPAGRGTAPPLDGRRLQRGMDVMEMARARNWRDARADALKAGHITEEGVPAPAATTTSGIAPIACGKSGWTGRSTSPRQ